MSEFSLTQWNANNFKRICLQVVVLQDTENLTQNTP